VRTKHKYLLIAILLVAAGIAILWVSRPKPPSQTPGADGELTSLPQEQRPDEIPIEPAGASETTTAPPPPSADKPQVPESFAAGMRLMDAGRLIEARSRLSVALSSSLLDPGRAAEARKALSDLAERTIFSHRVHENDPYTFYYKVRPGEVLSGSKGIIRRNKLYVPAQLILKINGIADARKIQAGQTLKMIKGPFVAVVTKHDFTMDIYLHRQGAEKIFIKRLRVGLGQDGSTPVGSWRVGLGKKHHNAVWYPPPNSYQTKAIRPGEQGYPLGREGYWIGLEGTDRQTREYTGYGIHGTDEAASIGAASSLGCIRLADADIELVYSLLYEKWSTVQVRP